MNVLQFAGKDIRVVTTPSEEAMVKFTDVLLDYYVNGNTEVNLERIGRGACGTVYKVNSEYALKVNNGGWAECLDGQILENLQGLPMIPTLYAYSADAKFTLMQLIDGVTVSMLWNVKDSEYNFTTNHLQHFESVVELYKGARAKKIGMRDLHSENVMVDKQGNLWVVDVGLFQLEREKETYPHGAIDLIAHVEYAMSTFHNIHIDYSDVEEWTKKCSEILRLEV